MSMAVRTPKTGRQSLFFQDLATPISSRKSGSKFNTPGQAAAVSSLWRENFATSDLPPPPVFTLEDRSDVSPESGILDYVASPEVKSDPRTPVQASRREFSTPKSKSEASTSYALMGKQQQQSQQSPLTGLTWWSPAKGSGGSAEQDDKGKGSPVEGVVHPGALITLPPPREVARPEVRNNTFPVGNLNEEEWVTVYGFSPIDTNAVLREFEKCGVILKHILGPRDANWMHILYQNRADALKALNKNGMQINGVLMIGVKPVDPAQRQALDDRLNKQGFIPLPHAQSSKNNDPSPFRTSSQPYYLQNGSNSAKQSSGSVATPARSVVSKIVDLMFGV
ncbi:Nuclear pore complex protein NUP35 [Capsicum baccatum]|uniref:Nuclear pore complex protein NUP35 n=1 Tax=Capsicum baccatum TaxID=33114 RepID=A0A2G2WP63_CAPBA|nr:Nuclear pore complex protein NUP35 [Capsicum baccatum]